MGYYSCKIVGWEVSSVDDGRLTCRALKKALETYPGSKPLHHSDRGSTYACKPFSKTLSLADGLASISRRLPSKKTR